MTGEGILVRSCMREKINRVTPYIREVADEEEMAKAARKKILEEVGEVLEAETREELLEELGDLADAMLALARCYALGWADIEWAAASKTRAKGAFEVLLAWKQPEE